MLAILGELCWLHFFKAVYLETSNVRFGLFFENPVTYSTTSPRGAREGPGGHSTPWPLPSDPPMILVFVCKNRVVLAEFQHIDGSARWLTSLNYNHRINYLFSDTMHTRTLVLVNYWTESYENCFGDTLQIAQLYLQL